jgi:hypothetical protein
MNKSFNCLTGEVSGKTCLDLYVVSTDWVGKIKTFRSMHKKLRIMFKILLGA